MPGPSTPAPSAPVAMVVRAAGTNCEAEMCRGFAAAGARVELVHVEALIREPDLLDEAALLGFPGGFSYGDDIASGRIFAMKLRERLYPQLRAAAERGVPMIGACNGFQVLVQVGLLPGPRKGEAWPGDAAPEQRVSLSDNQDARFVDRWVGVAYEPRSVCVWTRGLEEMVPPDVRPMVQQLPVAHGEGRIALAAPGLLGELERGGQIALRYTDNFNGSEGAIAGICDAGGRIFGLMPHPERYLEWTRHPFWTRLPEEVKKGETPGMRIFRNGVAAAGLL